MEETRFTENVYCNHCSNTAPMRIVTNYSKIARKSAPNFPEEWSEGSYWELIECPACANILLREGYYHEFLDDEPPNYKYLYPSTEKKILGLPDKLSKAFEAASRVKHIDSNAYAVLLGRVLDLLCIDQSANGESLYEKLKDIADKNIIPDRLADMAHGIRQFRNIGAHANLGELTESELPILETLIRAVLEYVYAAPAMVTSVQSKIDELKS